MKDQGKQRNNKKHRRDLGGLPETDRTAIPMEGLYVDPSFFVFGGERCQTANISVFVTYAETSYEGWEKNGPAARIEALKCSSAEN